MVPHLRYEREPQKFEANWLPVDLQTGIGICHGTKLGISDPSAHNDKLEKHFGPNKHGPASISKGVNAIAPGFNK